MSVQGRIILIIIAGLALMLPAMINGSMLLFPDSVGYYNAGEASLEKAAQLIGRPTSVAPATSTSERHVASVEQRADNGVSTSRSVYFGIPMVILYRIGGAWALPVVMVIVTLASLFNALPLLLRTNQWQSTIVTILLGLFTGLAVVADTALPDLFAGLMILAAAITFSFWASLSSNARFGWVTLLLVSCLFHKSITAVAATMIIAYAAIALADRRRLRTTGIFVGILVAAFVGHAAVSITVERVTKRSVVDAPFLLARVISDGTAKRYLDKHCAEEKLKLCHYRSMMPMSENQFLWSRVPGKGVMGVIPLAERRAIISEGNSIVFGTLRENPGAQLVASTRNFIAQFFLVGVTEYLVSPRAERGKESGLSELLNRYPETAIGRTTLPLEDLSIIMRSVYLASFAVILCVVFGPRRARFGKPLRPEVAALAWIMFGLIVNAAVSGVLAGVFDRYQGRVAWLMPLAALMAVNIAISEPNLRRDRRGVLPNARFK